MVFATILICINGAILEPEVTVFTTPKLQPYQLKKLSLCLLIPDPAREHTAPSVVPVLLFMTLTTNWSTFSVLERRRGGVTLKYGYFQNKYASQHLNTNHSTAQLQKQHTIQAWAGTRLLKPTVLFSNALYCKGNLTASLVESAKPPDAHLMHKTNYTQTEQTYIFQEFQLKYFILSKLLNKDSLSYLSCRLLLLWWFWQDRN